MVHKITKQFEWSFEEYPHQEKSSRWLVAFLVIVICGGLIALVLGNNLFAGVIIIGGIAMFYISRKEPKEINLEISERGIKHNETLYNYEKINYFWITDIDNDGYADLLFIVDKGVFPLLSVPIPQEIDLVAMKNFLNKYIEESEIQEPWLYKIVDRLGI